MASRRRLRGSLAALALAASLAAACAPKPPPAPPPQMAAALATVPPALDAAEAVVKACPQPGIAVRAEIAIQAARAEWRAAAGGDAGALVGLKTHLELLRATVDTCKAIARAVADYRARCRGDVRLGMTAAEVKATAWCAPTKTRTAETAKGTREEWVYRAANIPGLDRPVGVLVFDGGRLVAIRREAP